MVSLMKQSLDSLTGLRFVAAFLVVVFHFGNPPSPQLVHNIISHGFVAVSLFFILSGFILTYNYMDGDGRLKTGKREFMVARLSRIYPAYLLAFLVYAPFALQQIATIDAHSPWVNTTYFALAALTLLQSWSDATVLVWNEPAWSLSAEAFFYLMFPFVAPFILRLGGRRLLAAGLLLWLASMAAFAVHQVNPGFDRNFWLFNPLMRLPEFLLGIVLGKLWLTRKPPRVQQLLETHAGWGVVASVAALLALFSIDADESKFYNGMVAPLLMALIYSLALGRGTVARLLALRPMVWLGEASYSLYILHWPLWFAITAFLVNYLPKFSKGALHFVACEVLTVAASLAVFRYVETPANRQLKKFLLGGKKPAASAGPVTS